MLSQINVYALYKWKNFIKLLKLSQHILLFMFCSSSQEISCIY